MDTERYESVLGSARLAHALGALIISDGWGVDWPWGTVWRAKQGRCVCVLGAYMLCAQPRAFCGNPVTALAHHWDVNEDCVLGFIRGFDGDKWRPCWPTAWFEAGRQMRTDLESTFGIRVESAYRWWLLHNVS